MDVIGCHQREIQLRGDLLELAIDQVLLLQPMVLHFEKEISWPENVPENAGGFFSFLKITVLDRDIDFAFETGTETNQPNAMFGQQLLINSRLLMEFGEARFGNQFNQATVPNGILWEQRKIKGRVSR